MAIAGHKSRVRISVGSDLIVFSDELTTTTDDQTYQIIDGDKRIWCRVCNIIVKDSGVATTEDFVLNRLIGTITFGTVDPLRVITVDGQYHPISIAGETNEYSYTIEGDNQDSTIFGNTFIDRTQGLLDFSGSFSGFKVDSFFSDIIIDDEEVVIELFSDFDNNVSILGWVKLSSVEKSSSVDGLLELSVDFEGTNDVDNRSISIS